VEQPTRFIGMDVHKDTIVVAVTTAGDTGKATPYGTFPHSAAGLEKLIKRLRQAGSGSLKFCYEAGPTGTCSPARHVSGTDTFQGKPIAHTFIDQPPQPLRQSNAGIAAGERWHLHNSFGNLVSTGK